MPLGHVAVLPIARIEIYRRSYISNPFVNAENNGTVLNLDYG